MRGPGATAPAQPGADVRFLRKAIEFQASMDAALGGGRLDSAGVLGVHAAISAADALTARHLRLHSVSANHEDAARLLKSVRVEGSAGKARQLLAIIAVKHLVEYEDRPLTQEEAETLSKQVHRFVDWVAEGLRKPR